MGWLTVPVTIIAAYIILGFVAIGNEIENPFSYEVSDVALELYCAQIASDVAIISLRPPAQLHEYMTHPDSKLLYPISSARPKFWPDTDVKGILDAPRTRAMMSKPVICRRQSIVGGTTQLSKSQSVGGSTLNEQDMCDFATRDPGLELI
jgi:putative membrane protein